MQDYDRQTMIDLFLVANQHNITDVKDIPSEFMDSDHRLFILITKFRRLKVRSNVKVKKVNVAGMSIEENNQAEILFFPEPHNRASTTNHWR